MAGDHAAIANGLLVNKCSSGLFGFEADVFVAGKALTFGESGGGEYLNAMADGEDPLLLSVEFADDVEEAAIVAEILRSATAQNEDGVILTHLYLVKGEVGLQAVAWPLDVSIPPWLKVVYDEMETTSRRSRNGCVPVCLAKAMNRVEGFVGFACVSSDD